MTWVWQGYDVLDEGPASEWDIALLRLSPGGSDAEVVRLYGERALRLLWAMWNEVDPRYLVLHLDGASDLPCMDSNGSRDAQDPIEKGGAPPSSWREASGADPVSRGSPERTARGTRRYGPCFGPDEKFRK